MSLHTVSLRVSLTMWVGDRRGELSRQRPAVVDIEARRLVKHVGWQRVVAADMAPRHPRKEGARLRFMVGLLVHRLVLRDDAGQNALRLDHRLGFAGGARGEDGLGVRVDRKSVGEGKSV